MLDLKNFKAVIEFLSENGSLTIQSEDHNLDWFLRENGTNVIMFNGKCFYSGASKQIAKKHFDRFNELYIKKDLVNKN